MAEQLHDNTRCAEPGTARIPNIVLAMTSLGLLTSLVVAGLVIKGIMDVPWNAKLLPLITLTGLFPLCVVGLLASCASFYVHRDARSLTAILLGVLATAASIVAFVVIALAGLAGHPV